MTADTPDPRRPAPAEPTPARIADAIRAALDTADLTATVTRTGTTRPATDGLTVLARCLDKAGLIDWAAFDTGEPDPTIGQGLRIEDVRDRTAGDLGLCGDDR